MRPSPTNITYDFSGRTVVVTGAHAAFSAATASQFVTSGAHVLAVDRGEDALVGGAESAGAEPLAADVATVDVERVDTRRT